MACLFKFAVLALTLSFSFIYGRAAPTAPKWPSTYMVSGYLRLPYAELDEPFQVWYDGANNRSRIDYYGGIVQTYQLGNTTQYKPAGVMLKVAYMTNQKVYNQRTCFKTDGSADSPVTPQSILPDLTGFKLVDDSYTMNGVNMSIWSKIDAHGSKVSRYTMYVRNDNGNPHRYEMYGYDSLLGSHFDKYYLDYETFNKADKIPDSQFQVDGNLTCDKFPGPGVASNTIHFNPMREFIHQDNRHHDEMFDDFKQRHNKKYDDKHEEMKRQTTFRHNVRFIQSKNRSPLSYSLAVNHLADRSSEELRLMNGRVPSKGYNGGQPFNKKLYSQTVPDSLDWRLYGAVTPVKDQAVCGSCWSFGTTGTIEGAHFLSTGRLVKFSQQELMDCSWGFGNNGCDGGEDFRAYQWIMDNGGLATELNYGAYKAVDFKCRSKDVNSTVNLAGYINVTSGDEEALRIALFNHGPVSVAIDASHLSLSFYANGVYYEEKCRSDPEGLDHAVLAVGYGTLHGQKYWLIKNSWSTYWGNDGYVLMSTVKNNCGVTTSPTFVKIASN